MAFKLLNAYYAYSQSFYLTQFKTPSKTVFMITNCMLEKFAHYALKLSPKYMTAILYGANYVVRKCKNVDRTVFIQSFYSYIEFLTHS